MPPFEVPPELIHELQRSIQGEVKADRLTRQLYSTDASSYRIAAAGTSCRQQIFDGTGRRAVHPIVILAEALAT